MKKRFITHIRTDAGRGVPETGKKKLFFYTRVDSVPDEWYRGTDNNSISEEQMRDRCRRGTAFTLPVEVELLPNKGLWFNKKGEVFYADLVKPNSDPERRHLFTSAELLELLR